MQAPLFVFNHVSKAVMVIPTAPGADKRLDEVLASQQQQVATSGRPAS